MKEVVTGLSANVEQCFHSGSTEEKRALEDMQYYLSGSSINTHNALSNCGINTLAIALMGNIDQATQQPSRKALSDQITRMNTQMVVDFEKSRGLNIEELYALDQDHYAITQSGSGYTIGRKGKVVNAEQVINTLKNHGKSEAFKLCTGIRASEISFAKTLLGEVPGKRGLNVKPEILVNPKLRKEILPYADFLFMNEAEFEILKMDMSEIHHLGVPFIAVTKGPNGLFWSFNNKLQLEHGVSVEGVMDPFTTGCGDWLAGVFIGSLIRMNVTFGNIEPDLLSAAVKIANAAAAEKIRYEGSSNGPGVDFMNELFIKIAA